MATFLIINTTSKELFFSGRKTDWAGLQSAIFSLQGYWHEFSFFYKGKNVSRDEMLDISVKLEHEYFSKRKEIWVHQGATTLPNTWRKKWVLK